MADLPEASVSIDDEGGAFAGTTGYIAVFAHAAQNADMVPRVFSSTKALLEQHAYSKGVSYCASHFAETKKPIIFCGLPGAVAGAIGSQDSSGVTGTSQITVADGSDGIADDVDGVLTVTTGGTVGSNGIVFTLSLDGGRTEKTIRLGTASSYTIPYVGLVISFGAGTLVANDVYTFRSKSPMWDSAGLTAARAALASQLKQVRSFMVIGDLPNSTYAGYVVTETNAYETSNDRFVYARGNVKDRSPLAKAARITKRMTGAPSLTFAEVGATGDTITRATGSWVTDGFTTGDVITVSGTTSNNFANAVVTGVTATVLTLDTQDLVAEVTTAASVSASPKLVFAEVGATADTITRSSGSWLDDGFAVGDTINVSGTASNNFTGGVIGALSATVLTLTTQDLVAETIGMNLVTIEKSQSMAAWVSAQDSAFATIDNQRRIDLALGSGRKQCPITGWLFRRPASWAASLREYGHDLQIPCWRKADGPLDGWSLEDEDGNIEEFDERVHGGGLAGRFTCMRTYSNGPRGAFAALSLTRGSEGSLLSRTHNMAVANLACTIAQLETENAIGQVLVLKSDGTGTEASLALIEERVNSSLQINLLQDKGEGQRASSAVWRASRTDVLNTPGATLNGVLTLLLNGTLEKIVTRVKVETAG
jgi:hypothetical protein